MHYHDTSGMRHDKNRPLADRSRCAVAFLKCERPGDAVTRRSAGVGRRRWPRAGGRRHYTEQSVSIVRLPRLLPSGNDAAATEENVTGERRRDN